MAVFLDKLNRNFELLPEKLQPWRWWILGLYLLLMLFLASGSQKKHQQEIKAKYPPTPWLKLFRKQFKVPVEFVKKYRHQVFWGLMKG